MTEESKNTTDDDPNAALEVPSEDDSVPAISQTVEDPPQDNADQEADIMTDTQNKSNTNQNPEKINRILSMKVPVIVKIAEKKMDMSDILKFHIGSVIQFDKDPYEYVDLMVNNSTIGAGQPVKVAENFGLKIMQIGKITDTIRSLGSEKARQDE